MKKRRNFSAAFKAKVALEALTGESTLAELAYKLKGVVLITGTVSDCG